MYLLPVVEEIVRHVIANVSEDTTTVRQHSGVPVIEDHRVRKFPERRGEKNEQSWWHHKSVLVHRQVMVDSVKEKVQSDTDSVVRKKSDKSMLEKSRHVKGKVSIRINVKQEPVHHVFNQSPEEEPESPVASTSGCTGHTRKANGGTVGDTRKPDDRNDIPRRLAERFQKVAKEWCRVTTPVVTRTMDLLEIELLAEAASPQLHKQGLIEIKELVLLVIFGDIRLDGQVFLSRHTRALIDSPCLFLRACSSIRIRLCRRTSAYKADEAVFQDFVGRLGMFVRYHIGHNFTHVFARIFEN